MAPKGQREQPMNMGKVSAERGSWIAAAQINGSRVRGPPRTERSHASADLERAQQSDTQDQMREVLLRLRAEVLDAESSRAFDEAHSLRGSGPGAQQHVATNKEDDERMAIVSTQHAPHVEQAPGQPSTHAQGRIPDAVPQSVGTPVDNGSCNPSARGQSLTVLRPGLGVGQQSSKLSKCQLRQLAPKKGVQPKRKGKWKSKAELMFELQEKDEHSNLPQHLARCGSAADRKAAERQRQTTDQYRAEKRARILINISSQ
jgi:hypothetical protein